MGGKGVQLKCDVYKELRDKADSMQRGSLKTDEEIGRR
jgi:hypothetical protein